MRNIPGKEIGPLTAAWIIERRIPYGRFWFRDSGVFVGVDNSDGDAWTEEFSDAGELETWLRGGSAVNAQGFTVG